MVDDRAQADLTLEARIGAAHHAYLEALIAWENALHHLNCESCRMEDCSVDEMAIACDMAQAEKEKRRIVFRDLCEELGRTPTAPAIGLPPERACRRS